MFENRSQRSKTEPMFENKRQISNQDFSFKKTVESQYSSSSRKKTRLTASNFVREQLNAKNFLSSLCLGCRNKTDLIPDWISHSAPKHWLFTASYLWAGGPSMIMLIHRICMALSGFGICRMVEVAISVRAAMLLKRTQHHIICQLAREMIYIY